MRSERGQATTETIVLTWIVLIFFAAIYQFHLVNQTIYRSMTAVHAALFERALFYNCADENNDACERSDRNATVVWNPTDFPEVRVPVVRIFQQWGLGGGGDPNLYSLRVDPDGSCAGRPCKRTTVVTGTVIGHFEGIDVGSLINGLVSAAYFLFSL